MLVVDVVIPPGREPHFGKFIDLNMLVMTGGLERTEAEFRKLLEGFGLPVGARREHRLANQYRQSRTGLGLEGLRRELGSVEHRSQAGFEILRGSSPCPTMPSANTVWSGIRARSSPT
jgi:hypothetical protein